MTIGISSVALAQDHDLVAARQRARQIATILGFDAQDQTRIATVVSEMARNVVRYAKSGKIEFAIAPGDVARLAITVTDHGPGIADLDKILAGAYVSKSGMGIGITGARRLMDDFQITSSPANGTTVRMNKIIPQRGGITPGDVERIEISGEDGSVDEAAARPERRFVDVYRDRRGDTAGVDAAKQQAADAGLALLDAEAWNLRDIIEEARSLLALQRIAADHAHRLRDVEDALAALLRGDDDLCLVDVGRALVFLRRRGRILNLCGRRGGGKGHQSAGREQ